MNTIILKIKMLVIKYGYMFQLILSHPQVNTVTEFCDHIGLRMA